MDLIAGLKSKLRLAPAEEEYYDEPQAEEAEESADDDEYGEPEREFEDFAVPQRRASEDFRRPPGPRAGSGLVSREDVKRYIRRPGYGRMEEPPASPYRPAPPRPDSRDFGAAPMPPRADSRGFAPEPPAQPSRTSRPFAPQAVPESLLSRQGDVARPVGGEDPWRSAIPAFEPPAAAPAPDMHYPGAEPAAPVAPVAPVAASSADARRSYAQSAFMGPRAEATAEAQPQYAYATQSSAPRPAVNPYPGPSGYAGASAYPEFTQQPGVAAPTEIVGGFLPNSAVTQVPASAVREIAVVNPSSFEDAESIAEALRTRTVAVISLKQVPEFLSRRIMDFAFGAASVCGATVGVVANKVYAITFDRPLNEYEILSLRNKGAL